MTKIRLMGTMEEIDAAIALLRQDFVILEQTKPYENRNGEGYRVYLDVEIPALHFNNDPALTPSYHGEDCLGNGEHPEYECCCDECDHYLICFPEYGSPNRESPQRRDET